MIDATIDIWAHDEAGVVDVLRGLADMAESQGLATGGIKRSIFASVENAGRHVDEGKANYGYIEVRRKKAGGPI
jgi:hypothetical protein